MDGTIRLEQPDERGPEAARSRRPSRKLTVVPTAPPVGAVPPITEGESLRRRYRRDMSKVLCLKIWGISLREDGEIVWSWRRRAATLAVGESPILLGLVLAIWWPPPDALAGPYIFWLFYFFGICLLAVILPLGCVACFYDLTTDLERMLTDEGRRAYDEWADAATSLRRQISYGVLVAALACGSLAMVEAAPGGSTTLYVSPASYLSVAFTGFMISGGGYWIGKGSFLAWKLTRPGMTRLVAESPVSTPGVESLARCYRLAFYGACLAMAVCLYPVLDWAYKIDHSAIQSMLKGTLSIWALVLCLVIAVVPQWYLSQLVWRTRRRNIRKVTDELETNQSEFLLGKFAILTASKPSTVNEATIAGLVLGLATAAFPAVLKSMGGS